MSADKYASIFSRQMKAIVYIFVYCINYIYIYIYIYIYYIYIYIYIYIIYIYIYTCNRVATAVNTVLNTLLSVEL